MPVLARVVAPLAGVIAVVVLFLATRGLDDVARGEQLGPGFWPRLVLAGLGLACVAKLIENLRRPASIDGARASGLDGVRHGALAVAVASIVLYVVLAPWLGFPLATAGFIAAFMLLAGSRSPVAVGIAAVAGTVVLLYVFVKLVYLPLPKGDGVFEALTLALYRGLRIF